jgi:hypothetical protein
MTKGICVRRRTDIFAKKNENMRMSSKIVNVDQMDNGVLVNFEDGVRSFFDAAFLYEQVEKRIGPAQSETE